MKRAGWLAALLLLVAVNALVLAGVAWNRSGEAQARLQLTERELPLQYRYAGAEENTGVALRVQLHEDSYAPAWLDADKLRALGFSLPGREALSGDAGTRLKRPLSRKAWVVLEFDGPAWRDALAAKAQRLADVRLDLESGTATRKQVESLEKSLARMRQGGSRLVAVDAGRDPAALRARYPDSTRYVVTGARVRAWVGRSREAEDDVDRLAVKGYLSLLVNRIHVPLQHRTRLQSVVGDDWRDKRAPDADQSPRYRVRLYYGRRHEPWVEAIAAP
jgi:hypothetical protein